MYLHHKFITRLFDIPKMLIS